MQHMILSLVFTTKYNKDIITIVIIAESDRFPFRVVVDIFMKE